LRSAHARAPHANVSPRRRVERSDAAHVRAP
jgi:hypothetical protein